MVGFGAQSAEEYQKEGIKVQHLLPKSNESFRKKYSPSTHISQTVVLPGYTV